MEAEQFCCKTLQELSFKMDSCIKLLTKGLYVLGIAHITCEKAGLCSFSTVIMTK